MNYFSSMISNKGFPFLLFYKPCVSSLLWWGEAGRLSNYLPHYSCPSKWYKVFPLFGRFLRILLRLQAEEIFCITRGTKNEVISGFWHNIQILSVLQRNSRNFGGRSSCYHSHLSLFYAPFLIIIIVTSW